MSDRTVHARLRDGTEIVRYDRAGKWFVESPDGSRERVTVREAARRASVSGATIYVGRAGGGRFDSALWTFVDDRRSRSVQEAQTAAYGSAA